MHHLFGLSYLWFNFRVYFLQPVHWGGSFPFVKGIEVPPAPAGQLSVDGPFGVLANIPVVWMALAAPLAWQKRTAGERTVWGLFIAALAAFFCFSALPVGFFAGACMRYEVEFVPALVLLAVCGILGLERALAAGSRWRNVARCAWVAALLFSVVVSLLLSVQRYAEEQFRDGLGQLHLDRPKEALPYFAEALRINPNEAKTHYYFAAVLVQTGRLPEAVSQYEQALQLDPDYPGARDGLLQARKKLQPPTAGPPN